MLEQSITPGARLTQLATAHPDNTAVICELQDGSAQTLSWVQLEQWANRLARRLAEVGVRQGDFVVINFPNCIEHIVSTLAIFKLGGCPTPINYRMPAAERNAMMELASPKAVLSDADDIPAISRAEIRSLDHYSPEPLPDAIPQPFKAIASGGSTGKPKLIVAPGAFLLPPAQHPFAVVMGIAEGDRVYSPGPLYHNQAFMFSQVSLFVGASVIINEKFDADRVLEVIERQRPTLLNVVPTMMLRMARSSAFQSRDLGSLKSLWHMASACADWVKRAWIERIGASRVCELWAATEVTGVTAIRGDEWLKRPGSVGRGFSTEIRILDEQRNPLPVNEVGEIFTRFNKAPPPYQYLGSKALETVGDDFTSVGDLGYLDEEGYLFLADRRVDLIISGGSNIYPAEVESVLTQFDGVRDCVVIGLKDDDLGRRVHALVEPMPGMMLDTADVDVHMRQHLARYKVPRSYEIVGELPRDEAGKIRRGKLRDERGG